MRYVSANRQVNFPIWIIIVAVIIGAGGLAIEKRGGFIGVTTNQIYAAENAYAAALTAADGYKRACVNGSLPVTCRNVVLTIQADVRVTDAAYQNIRGYEANPPTGVAQTFLAAVATLQAAIPPGA